MRNVTTLSVLALAALTATAAAAPKDTQTLKFTIPAIREISFDHSGANASGVLFSFTSADFTYGSNTSVEKTAADTLSIMSNKAGYVEFSATALPASLEYLKFSVSGQTFTFTNAQGNPFNTLTVTPGSTVSAASWATQANLSAPLTNDTVTVTATLLHN
ncbi:hypothetical protein [Deinococcus planocerae]|uniref:hypothetical protein n=1 Tax=Deinococcus planocerae TaxID=1737569 RepID=UPI000C7F30C7|nr:hypothetical protein [Deinococcus planocerae]